jgi:xanthine dehydrogenase YagR molybdenum-binding subunit
VVSERTGIPVERIDVVLGDSSLAAGPRSGGSRATATVLPAIADAANAAIDSLLVIAVRTSGSPFEHRDPAALTMTAGRVHAKQQLPESGVPFEQLLRMAKVRYANGDGRSGGLGSDSNADALSTHSFGAQFAEVEWDPGIARLRVSRVVSVIDGGRIINRATATNQIVGAVVMGVGMSLLEETIYDQRSGHPVTDNFADYIVPTHADVPAVDVTFLGYPDRAMGEYGARGIGEIGLAGVAPAITAAVYHATGIRVRELPVRIEQLLQAKREA